MNLKSLQRKAKQLIDRRGGTDSLKADAEELKDIAKGPGSVAGALARPCSVSRPPPLTRRSQSGMSPISPGPRRRTLCPTASRCGRGTSTHRECQT